MHHFDDLAGKVAVESDGDMREALETVLRHTYISIHTYLGLLMHMHSMYICCVHAVVEHEVPKQVLKE